MKTSSKLYPLSKAKKPIYFDLQKNKKKTDADRTQFELVYSHENAFPSLHTADPREILGKMLQILPIHEC